MARSRFVKAGGVLGYSNVLAARTNGGYRRYFAVAAGIGRASFSYCGLVGQALRSAPER